MPFAPEPLILQAAERMQKDAHPLLAVVLMAMLKQAAQSNTSSQQVLRGGLPWGGEEERTFLDQYFRLPGAPDPAKPYRAVWQSTRQGESWVSSRYPDTGLQRMRKDRAGQGKVFHQVKASRAAGRSRDLWGVTEKPGADLLSIAGIKPVRLADLALWFGRRVDAADLDSLLDWFGKTFSPDVLDLMQTVLTDETPGEYLTYAFVDEPVSDKDLAEQLGGLQQARGLPGTFEDIVVSLEQRVQRAGFQLPQGLVSRVLTAWLRGDVVVLVGQPGTGKTRFASLLGKGLQELLKLDDPLVIPIRADFDEAEFIGYERLDGEQELRPFAREVLTSDRPLDGHIVILEEFNLATIESYLSSVLVASQEEQRLVRLPGGERRSLPIDTFILATCNSYIDEPETRTRVSAPTKRRATVITMPNVLADAFDTKGAGVVVDLAVELISVERQRVADRAGSGLGSMFDPLRTAALDSVTGPESMAQEVRDRLQAVASAILDTPEGRSWFTMGILRDISLAIAYANRHVDWELAALIDAVADKVVPQLRGPHERADRLLNALAGLQGAAQVERLLDRMKDGPPEELMPLL